MRSDIGVFPDRYRNIGPERGGIMEIGRNRVKNCFRDAGATPATASFRVSTLAPADLKALADGSG
jgi:hypothetical protein